MKQPLEPEKEITLVMEISYSKCTDKLTKAVERIMKPDGSGVSMMTGMRDFSVTLVDNKRNRTTLKNRTEKLKELMKENRTRPKFYFYEGL